MNRWIPDLCLLAGIGVTWLAVAVHGWVSRSITRHVNEALPPSNVVRIDSRRKAGEHVTVVRSVR